jgi:hypothetical protein
VRIAVDAGSVGVTVAVATTDGHPFAGVAVSAL